jgi:hypothetical protein
MASTIYTQARSDGTRQLVRRLIKQGRKPQGLGKPKLVRLNKASETKLLAMKEQLGYLYNENEIIRNSVEYCLNNIYTELLKH